MWDKIKSFFQKFWWIVLVPVAMFILHVVFKKETPELDKAIKEKEKELKQDKKKHEEAQKTASDAKEDLESIITTATETKESIDTGAKARDELAKEFFK